MGPVGRARSTRSQHSQALGDPWAKLDNFGEIRQRPPTHRSPSASSPPPLELGGAQQASGKTTPALPRSAKSLAEILEDFGSASQSETEPAAAEPAKSSDSDQPARIEAPVRVDGPLEEFD